MMTIRQQALSQFSDMYYMRISGNEPSLVIFRQTKWLQK